MSSYFDIAVIPARGGSTRIPRKNVREFRGHPIILYSIMLAKAAKFGRIVVSTDDDEIAKVSADAGAEIHWRSPELCENDIGTQEVVKHVLLDLNVSSTDMVCCIYPCVPLLDACDLEAAVILSDDNWYVWSGIAVGSAIHDAGQFYYGMAENWLNDVPLTCHGSAVMILDGVVDINTMDDWERAEKIYEAKYEYC